MQDEPKTGAGASAGVEGLTVAAVLERVNLGQPGVADEWKAASVEVRAASQALGLAMSGDEAQAIAYSTALAQNVQRVAVRMARASRALSLAYEALTVKDVAGKTTCEHFPEPCSC